MPALPGKATWGLNHPANQCGLPNHRARHGCLPSDLKDREWLRIFFTSPTRERVNLLLTASNTSPYP